MVSKIKNVIADEIHDYKLLLRNVPCVVMTFFVMSVVLMNLFANKELLNLGWFALDCGFCLSWLSFLCMDMLTKRFGAKAAIKISLFAVGINIIASLIFWIISLIPSNWSAYYTYNDSVANEAIDSTIGNSWYVVCGSMLAFAVASIVNAVVNSGLGKMLKSNSFKTFAIRSYVSTALGQLVDNLIFALVVSHVFFGWSMWQVVTCSIAGALMELLSEVIFSPIGYKVAKRWDKDKVGEPYLNYIKEKASI